MPLDQLPLEILIAIIDLSSSSNLHVSKAISLRVCQALKHKYDNIANYSKLITTCLKFGRLPVASLKYMPDAPLLTILQNIMDVCNKVPSCLSFDCINNTREWLVIFISAAPNNERLKLATLLSKHNWITPDIICCFTTTQLNYVPWLLKKVQASDIPNLLNKRHFQPEQNAILICMWLRQFIKLPAVLPHVCCVRTLHRILLANGGKKFIPSLRSISNSHLSGDCASRVIADDIKIVRGEIVNGEIIGKTTLSETNNGWPGGGSL